MARGDHIVRCSMFRPFPTAAEHIKCPRPPQAYPKKAKMRRTTLSISSFHDIDDPVNFLPPYAAFQALDRPRLISHLVPKGRAQLQAVRSAADAPSPEALVFDLLGLRSHFLPLRRRRVLDPRRFFSPLSLCFWKLSFFQSLLLDCATNWLHWYGRYLDTVHLWPR